MAQSFKSSGSFPTISHKLVRMGPNRFILSITESHPSGRTRKAFDLQCDIEFAFDGVQIIRTEDLPFSVDFDGFRVYRLDVSVEGT